MILQRGQRDDVIRVKRIHVRHLQDVELPTSVLTCLAVMLFLSKHAAGHVSIIVDGDCHAGIEEDDG